VHEERNIDQTFCYAGMYGKNSRPLWNFLIKTHGLQIRCGPCWNLFLYTQGVVLGVERAGRRVGRPVPWDRRLRVPG